VNVQATERWEVKDGFGQNLSESRHNHQIRAGCAQDFQKRRVFHACRLQNREAEFLRHLLHGRNGFLFSPSRRAVRLGDDRGDRVAAAVKHFQRRQSKSRSAHEENARFCRHVGSLLFS